MLRSGIRSIKVSNGHLVLNGQNLNFRGVGMHEASQEEGFAIDNGVRERIVNEAKALGATVLRTHYPMHPYTHELADRLGLLIWSEVPVYAVKTQYLKRPLVRELAAKELREEHRGQPEPPVGDAVVAGQRALGTAGAGPGRVHQGGGGAGQGARPDAPGRRSRSPAIRASAARRRPTRRST